MATKEELLSKRMSYVKAIERIDRQLKNTEFVDKLEAGVYVYGVMNNGEEFRHALLLGITDAVGTAGAWYKLRLNEGTINEDVKSVRISNITGVEKSKP
jgi:hypothetical protein